MLCLEHTAICQPLAISQLFNHPQGKLSRQHAEPNSLLNMIIYKIASLRLGHALQRIAAIGVIHFW